jgi:DNA-binding transcriptional LysR family regulator
MNPRFRAAGFDATRLKQLRFVEAVARLGSLVEAAAELHMTPSAASMLLRGVEQSLGGTLFERTAHGMVLTARASALLPRLRTLLGEADALAAAARQAALPSTVRLGFVASLSETVLPRAVSVLTTQRPGWRVQLVESSAVVLAQKLHEAQLDLVLGKMPADFPARHRARLSFHRLYEDEVVVVASKRHPLARRRLVPLVELHRQRWVLQPAGSTTRNALDEAWLRAGHLAPEPVVECPSYLHGFCIVEVSELLTCCSAAAARATPRGVTVLRTPLAMSGLPVGMFWRTGSAVAEELAAVLRQELTPSMG